MSVTRAYAAYEQAALMGMPAEQVVPVAPAGPQLSDHLASGTAQAPGAPQPMVSSLPAEAAKGKRRPGRRGSSAAGPRTRRRLVRIATALAGPGGDCGDPPGRRPFRYGTRPRERPGSSTRQPACRRYIPVDLTTLNRAAAEFFARLETLAEDVCPLSATGPLTRWVVLALTTTGAFEFVRRRLRSSGPSTPAADGGDSAWDLSTVLTLLPPEDVL